MPAHRSGATFFISAFSGTSMANFSDSTMLFA
jgi:hypothetical protein